LKSPSNKKTHFGLPVKCLTFLSSSNQNVLIVFSQQTFIIVPNIKDYTNLSNGIHTEDIWTYRQTDKWINIRKLIGSLCDYTNAPKNVVGIEMKTLKPNIILITHCDYMRGIHCQVIIIYFQDKAKFWQPQISRQLQSRNNHDAMVDKTRQRLISTRNKEACPTIRYVQKMWCNRAKSNEVQELLMK